MDGYTGSVVFSQQTLFLGKTNLPSSNDAPLGVLLTKGVLCLVKLDPISSRARTDFSADIFL